jgi:hypothetical protein
MEGSEVRIEEGTLRQTYVGKAWKRAMSKYSVEVEVNGKRYSAWVNPHDGGYYSELDLELKQLGDHLRSTIIATRGEAPLNDDVITFNKAVLAQPF